MACGREALRRARPHRWGWRFGRRWWRGRRQRRRRTGAAAPATSSPIGRRPGGEWWYKITKTENATHF